MQLFSGFVLGFLGSLHCVGMCGPIALALPWKSKSKAAFAAKQVLYFVSKAAAYALLGLFTGLIGDSFRFFGLQQAISITIGIVMLIIGVVTLSQKRTFLKFTVFDKLLSGIRGLFSKFLKSENPASFTVIGFLNGFLPCGFVYLGLGASLVTNSALQSAVFMFLFGMGTIPALLMASLLPSVIRTRGKFQVRRLIPVLSILFACIFILRGLNLGIPFLSPKMHGASHTPVQQTQADCCK